MKNKSRKLLYLALGCILFLGIWPVSAGAVSISDPGAVWFVDGTRTIAKGTAFTTSVNYNSGSSRLAAYNLDIYYDSNVIAPDTSIGRSGVVAGANGFLTVVNAATPGRITISSFDITGKDPGTNQQLLIINWKALNTGTSSINLFVTAFSDVNANTIGTPSGMGATIKVVTPSPGEQKAWYWHWPLDSNGSDTGVHYIVESKNSLMALSGSATYTSTDPYAGTAALSLDGNGSAATLTPVTTAIDNVTLSAWVKWNGGNSNQLIVYNGHSGLDGYGIMLFTGNSNRLSLICGGKAFLNSDVALQTGKWTHLAAVRRNGTWELWVDGSYHSVTNNTLTPNIPQQGPTSIGVLFNGLIDEVEIFNQALTATDIKQHTVSNRNDYKAAWYFNCSSKDSSGNGYNLVLNGQAAYDLTYRIEGTGSLALSGSNGYASSPSLVTDATDNITLSALVRWNGGSGNQIIVYNGDPNYNGYGIIVNTDSDQSLAILCGGSGLIDSNLSLPLRVWTYVAAVRSNGVWSLYVENMDDKRMQLAELTVNTPACLTPAGTTSIGAVNSGSSFNGCIDAVKIYTRPLCVANLYTQGYLPPYASGDKGAFWYLNGDGEDGGGSGRPLLATGNIAYSTTDTREGTASLSLNGTGNLATSTPVITATDNITLCAWVKWSGVNGNQLIVYNGNSSLDGYGIMLFTGNSNRLSLICGGINFLNSGVALQTGKWTHLAAVRRNGTWELWVNGIYYDVTNNKIVPNTPQQAGTSVGIGFNGLIDDARVYAKALSGDEIRALTIFN